MQSYLCYAMLCYAILCYAILCYAMLYYAMQCYAIRPSDKQKCPFVHWTNKNVHWTFKCPFVQWTNGHCLMANTSASYRQGVMLNHITSLYFIALLSDAVKVTCPFDIMKCPLDIQKCLFFHRTNRNVYWTFKCPFVHWTNRNVHWTFKCPLDILQWYWTCMSLLAEDVKARVIHELQSAEKYFLMAVA